MVHRARTLVVAAVVAMAGCSTKTEDVASDGGVVTACADAGEAPETYPFDAEGALGSAPLCQPSCGAAARVDGFYTVEALPFGACSGEDACDIGARRRCPCDVPGPVDGYRCRCVSGTWQCAVSVVGGAICACFDSGGDGEN